MRTVPAAHRTLAQVLRLAGTLQVDERDVADLAAGQRGELALASLPGFLSRHPLAPTSTGQGFLGNFLRRGLLGAAGLAGGLVVAAAGWKMPCAASCPRPS